MHTYVATALNLPTSSRETVEKRRSAAAREVVRNSIIPLS